MSSPHWNKLLGTAILNNSAFVPMASKRFFHLQLSISLNQEQSKRIKLKFIYYRSPFPVMWWNNYAASQKRRQTVTSYEAEDAGRPSFWHLHLKQLPISNCFPVIPHISSLLLNPIELGIYKSSLSSSVTSRLVTQNTALFIHFPKTQRLQDKA